MNHSPGPYTSFRGHGRHAGARFIKSGTTFVAKVYGHEGQPVDANEALFLAAPDLYAACKVLAAIADAYDDNALDDEARKFWGENHEHRNTTPPEQIELYDGRGGKRLLTLADCFAARAAVRKAVHQ